MDNKVWSPTAMDAKEQTLSLMGRLWTKLQNLPTLDPVDQGGFVIILTFIMVVVLMGVCVCVTCCCYNRTMESKRRNIV